MLCAVLFLLRRDTTAATVSWWTAVERYESGAPSIRELMRGPSVAAGDIEVQQAVVWARSHPAWRDDDPPLVAQEGVVRR